MLLFRQGDLDDLCGVYALLNALRRVIGSPLSEKRSRQLYRFLIDHLAKNEPAKLIDGTLNRDFEALFRLSATFLPVQLKPCKLRSTKFRGRTSEELVTFIDSLLIDEGFRSAAILSVSGSEDDHWIVVTHDALGELEVLDSSEGIYPFVADELSLVSPPPDGWHVKRGFYVICAG